MIISSLHLIFSITKKQNVIFIINQVMSFIQGSKNKGLIAATFMSVMDHGESIYIHASSQSLLSQCSEVYC